MLVDEPVEDDTDCARPLTAKPFAELGDVGDIGFLNSSVGELGAERAADDESRYELPTEKADKLGRELSKSAKGLAAANGFESSSA